MPLSIHVHKYGNWEKNVFEYKSFLFTLWYHKNVFKHLNERVNSQSILYPMLSLWNLKHRAKTLHFLLSNAMFCTMFFQKHCPPMFLTMFYKKQNIVLTMPLTVLIAHLYLLYLFIIWWLHRYRQSMQIPNEQ